MRYRFHTADVFTARAFGGNQLAVFPDGTGLTSRQMQSIAREFNFSETVFVLPPADPRNTRRLRIFTPSAEIPFAGHPTVGTAHTLVAAGEVRAGGDECRILFEEGIGLVPVLVRQREGRPFFAQLTAAKLPEFGPEPPPPVDLASVLSIDAQDILTSPPLYPESVSCGLPFLFVPLKNLEALGRARIQRERWESVLSSFWAPQVFVFTTDTGSDTVNIRARMFAPGVGVEEDPATGSAAAALAGYLARRERSSSSQLRWTIEQGVEMGRPSRLEVEADRAGETLQAVRVGGATVMVTEGTMEVPAE